MNWKDFTYQVICDFCNDKGSRTFTLKEFYKENEYLFAKFRPYNKNIEAKVRQQLQMLRDDGLLTFVDNRGTYTLRGIYLLKDEVEDSKLAEIKSKTPEKKEYLVEIYARNIGWVKHAKDVFGFYCMCPKCSNTFIKEDGIPYIEVHHIIYLCKGGEDAIWNLSVLCAHHHRMAHYADSNIKIQLEKILLNENEIRR